MLKAFSSGWSWETEAFGRQRKPLHSEYRKTGETQMRCGKTCRTSPRRSVEEARLFNIVDLHRAMESMFPGVEDDRSDNHPFEHPLTAVGIVLLTAALLDTVDSAKLASFTGYSQNFISTITLNMLNNRLWVDGHYDHSEWLTPNNDIDSDLFWNHVEIASGTMWMPESNTSTAADPCTVYWAERGGL